MAKVSNAQPVYVVPTKPSKGQGLLPIPPGRQPVSFNMTFNVGAVAGQQGPFYGPGFIVPAGMTTRIRANPANVGNAYVGFLRENVVRQNADIIAPNTEIIFPADNLCQLVFWFANAGDGVTISVRNE